MLPSNTLHRAILPSAPYHPTAMRWILRLRRAMLPPWAMRLHRHRHTIRRQCNDGFWDEGEWGIGDGDLVWGWGWGLGGDWLSSDEGGLVVTCWRSHRNHTIRGFIASSDDVASSHHPMTMAASSRHALIRTTPSDGNATEIVHQAMLPSAPPYHPTAARRHATGMAHPIAPRPID